MTESTEELPSKTESDGVERLPLTPPLPQGPDVIMLAHGEADHLKQLEEKNRYLTMLLGDRMMELDSMREDLREHRKALTEAYSFVLATHGVEQGKVNTNAGIITVLKRVAKES